VVNVKDLERIIALALASGHIEGEKPLSLMLVSDRPESGKTEVVLEFTYTKPEGSIVYVTDITAYGLWRDLAKSVRGGALKHIIIPEMITPLNKGIATANHFVSTLQTLIEDGVFGIHTGFLKPIEGGGNTVGVVGCLPRTTYNSHRNSWRLSGFLSRFLIATYKQGDDTVDAVFKSIRAGTYLTETKIQLVFPDEPIAIDIPENVAQLCEDLAVSITAEARARGELYGYREVKNIRRMVAANVILNNTQQGCNNHSAQISDFDAVNEMSYLFNEQYNAVRQ